MNRKLLLFCCATLPLFFLFNILQSYRVQEVERRVVEKESQQKDWIEKNNRLLTGIAILSSPARIEKLAQEMRLEFPASSQVIKVEFKKGKGTNG